MRTSAIAVITAIATISVGVAAGPAVAAPVQASGAVHSATKHPIVTPVHSGAAPRMGRYSLEQFAASASKLPSGLTSQLQKQLGISGAQFLADGQAASDASQVIASLRTRGVDVTGSKMNGTSLTVYVPNTTDAAAATAAGATAIVGTQPQPAKPKPTFKTDAYTVATTSPGQGTSPLLGGDGWAYFDGITTDSSGSSYYDLALCSVGFLGYNHTSGGREFATAGHCADYNDTGGTPPSDDINGVNGSVYSLFDAPPNPEDDDTSGIPLDYAKADTLGVLSTSAFKFGSGDDYGTVPVTDSQARPANEVTTWGGTSASSSSAGVQNAGTPVSIIADEAPIEGDPICHSGDRTGWQCGTIQSAESAEQLETDSGATQVVDGFTSTAYVCSGDSGGSMVTGEYAVGTLTGGNWPEPSDGTCDSQADSVALAPAGSGPLVSIAFPLVSPASGDPSFAHDDASFELGVIEPSTAPSLTRDSNGTPTEMSGTLAFADGTPAVAGTAVSLKVDKLAAATTTSAANGDGAQAWQFALSDLQPGTNTYTLTVGTGHSAVSHSGTFTAPPVVFTSASISGTAAVGDTLTANAGGEVSGAALTYQWKADGKAISSATAKTFTPTSAQLGDTITVTISGTLAGYTSATKTSPATAAVTRSVTRVAGADRWATAVAASKAEFRNGASTVFIASGENYPDALSAAPAAAKTGGDLLLTAPTSLPSSVSAELKRLKPTTVYLIGGTSAISAAVASQVDKATGVTATRIYGADRYATSAAIVAKFFPSATAVFAATGAGFPDALSGAGAAAALKDPVLLVPGTSSAPTTAGAAQLKRLKPSVIYIVGGPAVVSTAMQSALKKTAPVTRLSGADRYATSVAVVREFDTSSAQAVIASGANFPDALVGSVLAGSKGAPLLLSQPTCMPSEVVTELTGLRADILTLMGGTSGLSAAVADEKKC